MNDSKSCRCFRGDSFKRRCSCTASKGGQSFLLTAWRTRSPRNRGKSRVCNLLKWLCSHRALVAFWDICIFKIFSQKGNFNYLNITLFQIYKIQFFIKVIIICVRVCVCVCTCVEVTPSIMPTCLARQLMSNDVRCCNADSLHDTCCLMAQTEADPDVQRIHAHKHGAWHIYSISRHFTF